MECGVRLIEIVIGIDACFMSSSPERHWCSVNKVNVSMMY